MSGICGIINLDGSLLKPGVLQNMAHAASHRGPDGIRYYTDGGVGLVNLALNVTPESVRESQPLISRDGNLILTADARIDNRRELIRSLKGHLKKDDPTDADLILASYQRWGEECPQHLIGDFAFAVWDKGRGRLFAARDPMAMRAFYYRVESWRMLFGTEVKQILAAPDVPARIFEPAVGAHLAACEAPPEWSFYEGILQLAPAHAMAVDRGGHRTWRYWDIDPDFRIEYAREEEYAEHFLEIFMEAVRCRLHSTKPVGLFLSGGMDSTSVASAGGWLLGRDGASCPDLRTYSWAFEELTQCDERYISDGIVGHYGLPATYVAAERAWPLKDYPACGPDVDGPPIVAYQVLMEHGLSAASAEGAGVMLSGHRGDLMVGMWIFDYLKLLRTGHLWTLARELREHERINNVPVRKAVGIYLLQPIKRSLWPPGRAEWLRPYVRQMLGRPQPPLPYPQWVRPEFAGRAGVEGLAAWRLQPGMGNFARDERYRAVFAPMHMRVATWEDRLYSRFGIVNTDPWADWRLVSFALAVPQDAINRNGENKRLVRRSMAGIMPEKVRRSAGKCSPEPLYHRAIKDWERNTVLNLIRNPEAEARGYVDGRTLKEYYETFLRRDGREDYRFWHTLTLEMWLRQHWS